VPWLPCGLDEVERADGERVVVVQRPPASRWGTLGVLSGYSRGTHRVLGGHSVGTHRVLEGVLGGVLGGYSAGTRRVLGGSTHARTGTGRRTTAQRRLGHRAPPRAPAYVATAARNPRKDAAGVSPSPGADVARRSGRQQTTETATSTDDRTQGVLAGVLAGVLPGYSQSTDRHDGDGEVERPERRDRDVLVDDGDKDRRGPACVLVQRYG
jgi:hypothetical protein